MAEIVLGGLVVALLVERFFANRAQAVERQKLVNAVLAKTPGELVLLNQTVDTPPQRPMPEPQKIDGFNGQAGIS